MEEKNKAWKTVSSKYLFRRPWLTVRCEDMLLPNGNHIPEYYILEYPDWVNTIAITKDGQFVFVRQYRPGIERTCYELCAGVCEKEDASPLVSAQRELWEETGYGKGNWQEYMVISANPSTHTNLTYCFLATDVELIDHQHLEATEDITVHLLTLEEVRSLLDKNEIMQALNAAPLWKYKSSYYENSFMEYALFVSLRMGKYASGISTGLERDGKELVRHQRGIESKDKRI